VHTNTIWWYATGTYSFDILLTIPTILFVRLTRPNFRYIKEIKSNTITAHRSKDLEKYFGGVDDLWAAHSTNPFI